MKLIYIGIAQHHHDQIFHIISVSHANLCGTAGKKGKVGAMVNYVLSKNMDKDALMRTPQGKVYFFTVTLLFDEGGKVDTAFFSKKLDSDAQDIMGLNAGLVKKIKEQRVSYKKYARKAAWFHQELPFPIP